MTTFLEALQEDLKAISDGKNRLKKERAIAEATMKKTIEKNLALQRALEFSVKLHPAWIPNGPVQISVDSSMTDAVKEPLQQKTLEATKVPSRAEDVLWSFSRAHERLFDICEPLDWRAKKPPSDVVNKNLKWIPNSFVINKVVSNNSSGCLPDSLISMDLNRLVDVPDRSLNDSTNFVCGKSKFWKRCKSRKIPQGAQLMQDTFQSFRKAGKL